MKRFICLMLGLLLLCTGVCSCKKEIDPSDSTPKDDGYKILAEQLGSYTVIRSSMAGSKLMTAVNEFLRQINELYGTSVSEKNDFFIADNPDYAVGEYEIIIGDAKRDEAESFLSSLRSKDWGYRLIGKKLVIAGADEERTVEALQSFASQLLTERKDVFFSNQNQHTELGDYSVDSLTVNGNELKDYCIVYPKANSFREKRLADLLQKELMDLYGYRLKVVPDSENTDGKTILIGNTAQVSSKMKKAMQDAVSSIDTGLAYYIDGTDSNQLWVSSETEGGIEAAITALCRTVRGSQDKTCSLSLDGGKVKTYAKDSYTSMSYNVFYIFEESRAERVLQMIVQHLPDTVGIQEATPEWIDYLTANLKGLYAIVGEGRDGEHNGEHSAVMYRVDRFALEETGTKWLSATPSQPASKFQGTSMPRIMTYAILKSLSTGERFIHVNTHIHFDLDIADKQLKVLGTLVDRLPDLPCIITGDFNYPNTDKLNTIMGKTGFQNSMTLTGAHKQTTMTDGNYVLDYAFVNSQVGMMQYRVCNEKIGEGYASDHHPVLVKWYILEAEP